MTRDAQPVEASLVRDSELLKQRSARRSSGGSPVAMEATLSSISDEVTAEAIERRAFETAEQARRAAASRRL